MKDLNQSDPEYIKAMSNFMVGKWEEAEEAFLQLREQYPKSSFIPLTLGNIFYSKGQLKKSIEWYHSALEIEPEWGVAWYQLGLTYFRMGSLVKSLEAFNKLVAMESQSHAMATYFVGLINFFLGRDDDSDTAFSQFHSMTPESMISNFFLAQLKIKKTEFSDAASLLEELLDETPNLSEGHYMLGQAYYGLHRHSDAIKSFQTVLKINPEDQRARNKLTLMTDSEW